MNPRSVLLMVLLVATTGLLALAAAIPGPIPGLQLLLGGPTDDANAPPLVRIATPADGAGAAGTLRVTGFAYDNDTGIQDVHVRIDGGPWRSVAGATRGPGAAAWWHEVDASALPRGEHLLEFRAHDGEHESIPASLRIATAPDRAPPTLAVAHPRPGQGLDRNEALTLAGDVAAAAAPRVTVHVPGRAPEAATVTPGAGRFGWTLTLPPGTLPVGPFTLEVRAQGDDGAPAIPARVPVAAARDGPAPSVRLLTPLDGEGFEGGGEPSCGLAPPCVLVTGTYLGGVDELLVRFDDARQASLRSLPGASVRETPEGGTFRFAWPLGGEYGGIHTLRVTPYRGGVAGAADLVTIQVTDIPRLVIDANVTADLTFHPMRFSARWPGGTPANATWYVNGEPAAEGVTYEPAFPRPGVREVEARALDDFGHVARARLVVTALNRAPIPAFTHPPEVRAGVPAVFDASASADRDGAVLAYRWTFGSAPPTPWSPSPQHPHTFLSNGPVTTKLEVRDDLGKVSEVADNLFVANSPPGIRIVSVTPEAPSIFDNVTLVAEAWDLEGPVAVSWDFGDGRVGTNATTVHRFDERGTFLVRARVTDLDGGVASDQVEVHVRNLDPVARFNVTPATPVTRTAVRFDDLSIKPDGRIVEWRWRFGDGTGSSGRNVTHVYSAPGEYVVSLEVTDDLGARNGTSRTLRVLNAPPEVDFTWEPRTPVAHNDLVAFRARVVDLDGNVTNLTWDFGDGFLGNGTDAEHRFLRSGVYNVTLRAEDELGAHAEVTREVRVLNARPTVKIIPPQEVYAGFPAILEASAIDPDGYFTRFRWAIEDGVAGSRAGASDRDPAWDYELRHHPHLLHNFTKAGTYLVTLEATDNENATTTDRLLVDVYPPPAGAFPPRVTVDNPQPGAKLRGLVRLAGSAHGVTDVVRVEVQLRQGAWALELPEGAWAPARGRGAWAWDLETRTLEDGAYELVARAQDARGQWGERRVPFFIANNASALVEEISLNVTSPRPGDVVSGTFRVEGVAYHPEGLTRVRVRVGHDAWRDATLQGADFHLPVDARDLDGNLTVEVRAYRGLDVYRAQAVPLQVRNQAPALEVLKEPPSQAYGVVTVEGRLAAGSPPSVVLWRVDEHPWRAAEGSTGWSFRVDTSEHRNGEHRLQVKAVSEEGVESPVLSYPLRVRNDPFPGGAEHPVPAEEGGGAPEVRAAKTPAPGPALLLATLLGLAGCRGRRTFGLPRLKP